MPHKQQPYWERKQSSYENVDVGPMITCVSCGVSRFRARFSNNQIRKYQEAIVRQQHNGPPASLPRCSDCTTGNVVELTCQGCQVTKGVDFFSSNQRKTPDNAKCRGCVQNTDDLLPRLQDALEEERIREEQSRPNNYNGSALPSMNGSVAGSALLSQTQSVNGDGVYMPDDRASAWGEFAESVRSPSPTKSTSTVSAPRSVSVYSQASGNSGFHKQGAYRAPAQARVASIMHREEIQRQEAQLGSRRDDSDDDEEFEL